MATGVDRNRQAPAPTNVDDAATEEFLCALPKCVLLLASLTAIGVCFSVPAEPGIDDVRGVVRTLRGMVYICCNAAALAASGFLLLQLLTKVLGTHGIRYSHLQFIINLDVLGLIGAYSAATVKTSISVVTLVAVVLLYAAIQVLLFLSKSVGRLLPHVQETPPQKCLKSQKRVRPQQTMAKYSAFDIAMNTAYEVSVGPIPLALCDIDTDTTYPETTELVYFHWHDTTSVASLVFILIVVLSEVFSKQRIMYRALQVAMALDLFTLVVAHASRRCPHLLAFVYICVIALVSLQVMVSLSEMFQTCGTWRRVLREKMEQCVPRHPDGEALGWNLEDDRHFVLLVAITMLNVIVTYNLGTSLSANFHLENRLDHAMENRAFHSNEFYAGNLTDQVSMSSVSSLWQENTSGNLNLAFYCNATAFTGFLVIIMLLANRDLSSRRMQWYVLRLCPGLQVIGFLGTWNPLTKSMEEIVEAVFLINSTRHCILVQSILGWLQHTFQVDPSDEDGSEEELEFGLAGGGTNGQPVAVEISAPVLGGALTLVLAIPVMRMLASPVKMVLAFFFASIGADLWRRLLARLLRALAMALHHRRNPGKGSVPAAFGTTSSGWNGWYMILATCNGLCKVIRALCSKACVWILVFVIWFPSLMPNLKLKFKIPKISALVGVLIALVTTAATTTTVDSPTTGITATEMSTSTTTFTTAGTSSRSRKHPPRVEPRPRRSCRPNTRLIGEEWVN
ncbi:hypothetical protein VPH35_114633 [Triticum aestivum]